jgi:amino acid adenylation domain-containing protein/thioester reductase-like protein
MNQKKYELTFPQKNIWLMDRFNTDKNLNNVLGVINIKDKFDKDVCEKVINNLIKRNDIFRTKISLDVDVPIQNIEEYKYVNIEFKDFSIYKKKVEKNKNIEMCLNEISNKHIDILKDKLYYIEILKYTKDTGAIVILKNHLITDAWSASQIISQITSDYISVLEGKSLSFEVLPQYEEYILKEKEYLASDKYIKDEEFFRYYLSDIKDVISLKNNNNIKGIDASRYSVTLDSKINSKIVEYSKVNRVSIYSMFLAALSTYVYRVLEKDDIILGTPVLNRSNFVEKKILGMFVSTMPIRIKISENITFLDLVKQISSETMMLFRHQKYPYSKTLEYIHKTTDIKDNLYNVILSYQNARTSIQNDMFLTEWKFQKKIQDELQIHIIDKDGLGTLDIHYDYQKSAFLEEEIKYINSRLITILNNAVLDINAFVEEIEIMDEKEKNKILYEFNDTDCNYPKDKTVLDFFDEQVIKSPDKIALVCEDTNLTYKELNKKANVLAYYLKNVMNIKKGDIVAIILEKNINQIVAIFAIMKLGATYLPILNSWPRERIDYILKDSDANLVIVDKDTYIDSYKNFNKIVNVNNIDYNINIKDNLNESKVSQIMYIIYTSGSTGVPKGTKIFNYNVVRLLFNDKNLFDFNEKDIWSMFHSYTFDFSVWEMYGALLYGGKLIIIPEIKAKDVNEFLKILRDEKVTILNQTPAYFYKLIDAEMLMQDGNLKVRNIIFGGEALTPKLLTKFNEKYPNINLINMYGITETTVHVTYKKLEKYDLENSISNIGKPIPTLKVYILDSKNKILPLMCKGEICVAGLGVGGGYLNREDLNKEKFIKNPIERYIKDSKNISEENMENEEYDCNEDNNYSKLYKSGDVGFLSADGDLVYCGRNDNQIKIRGFRIEIGEVENKLKEIKELEKSVLLVNKEGNTNKLICFYINNKISVSSIINKAIKILPSYMLPVFIKVDEFKLTQNLKIDRNYLIDYYKNSKNNMKNTRGNINDISNIKESNKTRTKSKTNTFSNLEKSLIDIIYQKTNLYIDNIDTNIFEYGIDSLQVLDISFECVKLGCNVTPQDLYEKLTIRNICKSESENENTNKNTDINKNIKEDEDFKKDIANESELEYFKNNKFEFSDLENVLITGTTGYVGIHILDKLLKNKKINKIYCLVRNKEMLAKDRLIKKYSEYFSKDITKKIGEKIIILEGDFTKENLDIKEEIVNKIKVDTLIHVGANVKHYIDYKKLYEANVFATKNILDFCETKNTKLAYISTLSVLGFSKKNKVNEKSILFSEDEVYFSQEFLNHSYIKTKFLAEQCIIKECFKRQVNSKIFRIGNIMPRYEDGKFQINLSDNAFINKLNFVIDTGAFLDELSDNLVDITPVDYVADAICKIITNTTEKKTELVNSKNIYHIRGGLLKLKDIIKILASNIKIVNIQKFNEILNLSKSKYKKFMIDYLNLNEYEENLSKNEFTNKILNDLDFKWPVLDSKYIMRLPVLKNQGGDKTNEGKI